MTALLLTLGEPTVQVGGFHRHSCPGPKLEDLFTYLRYSKQVSEKSAGGLEA